MNRLQSELNRLYLPQAPGRTETDEQPSSLLDPSGRVRAMVMELASPPSWEDLSRVWRGVQTELGLPAPAVAVSGLDSLQLWFSLEEPIKAAQAHAFLGCLRLQFLADTEPSRVRLMPALDTSAPRHERHAPLVPACQEQTGNWSAFVAPDLAPVFADSPWLDVPPNEEGQATLLRGVEVMKQALFDAAVEKLGPSRHRSPSTAAVAASTGAVPANGRPAAGSVDREPRQFLLQVMHDDSAPLALRVEAAKALLQHSADVRPQRGD